MSIDIGFCRQVIIFFTLCFFAPNSTLMALSTFVKISNISNLSDARYCAGMMVDQLGFNLNQKDKEGIPFEKFLEIKDWVAGVQIVGEFGDITKDEFLDVPGDLPVDMIEISNLEVLELAKKWGKPISFKIDLFHHLHLNDLSDLFVDLNGEVDQVVIDSKSTQLLEEIKNEVNAFSGDLKFIKAFNVHLDTLNQLDGFDGIQLKGTEEDQPGLKDYGEVMDILEALEID